MSAPAERVVLFDVDNTLVDNDTVKRELGDELERRLGTAARDRYWEILEELREELGYVDYLGAIERYRLERLREPGILRLSCWLVDYPFAERLYPGALEVVRGLGDWATTVVFSDGDAVFQPRKIDRSGLWDAVDGRVLIYVHKERMLTEIERLYPARRYVMVDDKLRILDSIKRQWRERVTTVFVRQGHYAMDRAILEKYPAADLSVDQVGELATIDRRRIEP